MIWKAPWGNHIDLDKILYVDFDGNNFRIHFQLLDKPIDVFFSFTKANIQKMRDQEMNPEMIREQWHEELIAAWTKHKASK